jgi:hypothetical protein
MQKLSYLGNIILVSMIWNSLGPNNNLSLQRFCHFDIPTKYQDFIGNQIVCPWIDSLMSLLMLIIDTNAFTYLPYQHLFVPTSSNLLRNVHVKGWKHRVIWARGSKPKYLRLGWSFITPIMGEGEDEETLHNPSIFLFF